MQTVELIQRKRDGEELAPEELVSLVEAFAAGQVPDFQMSAFLMAVYFAGLGDKELTALTDCLLRSTEKTDLSAVPGMKVDKHSTGGVGDKTSLIAAPLAASAGVVVPMASSRAVGHAGGTLDKLESIPGFRADLSPEEIQAQLAKCGLCYMGQSARRFVVGREVVRPAGG